MADAIAFIDGDVYRTPSAAAVARLIESHGLEAASQRWHWLGTRTLSSMAQAGRAASGQAPTIQRDRSYTDIDAAVCVEAGFVLRSLSRGERAAGISKVRGRGICASRGLTPPTISPEERGRASRIGHAANAGDTAAIAEREARHDHERAVGRVLRRALALVPSQPATGRYVLPLRDDALRAALAGEPTEAVAAIFPEFDLPDPKTLTAQPEEPPVTETTDRPAQPRRRLPDENIVRADHADGQRLLVLAAHYGVAPQTLYKRWRQYGLSGQGRLSGYVPASVVNKRASAETPRPKDSAPLGPDSVPAPSVSDPTPVHAPAARLGLGDLAMAAGLVRRGVHPNEAVALVRADIAACAATSDDAVTAWFDAVVECGLAETEAAKATADARYGRACQAFGLPQ